MSIRYGETCGQYTVKPTVTYVDRCTAGNSDMTPGATQIYCLPLREFFAESVFGFGSPQDARDGGRQDQYLERKLQRRIEALYDAVGTLAPWHLGTFVGAGFTMFCILL